MNLGAARFKNRQLGKLNVNIGTLDVEIPMFSKCVTIVLFFLSFYISKLWLP